jgi:hemerythrin superfamily protein
MKPRPSDAISLLKKDHETVKKLFAEFKSVSHSDEGSKKEQIVEEIIGALELHATVEEEIFYPAVRKARAEQTKDEVREAYEEHKQIKAVLAALNDTTPNDETYDSKVKVLQEDVEHHVKEEEGEMFPDAKKFLGAEKLQSLGEQIARRKEEVESN